MGDVETVESVEDRMQGQQIMNSINMMLDEEEESKGLNQDKKVKGHAMQNEHDTIGVLKLKVCSATLKRDVEMFGK